MNEKNSLIHLYQLVNWESFRTSLKKARDKKWGNNAGRKAFDVALMFKVLVLQHLYNVSDDEVEYQICDRYSFCRFLRLTPEDRMPNSKNIWLFREILVKADVFYVGYLCPHINFHCPCFFPEIKIDAKEKQCKTYPFKSMMTPYEKLRSFVKAEQYLKPGITFEILDELAMRIVDNESAIQLRT